MPVSDSDIIEIIAKGADYQRRDSDSSIAEHISQALKKALNNDYQVITYKTYGEDSYDGFSCCKLPKSEKWCYVKKIDSGCASYDKTAVLNYIKQEYDWAAPKGAKVLAESIKAKVNGKFSGCFKVLAVKDISDYDYVGQYTTRYTNGDYEVFVNRW